VLCLTGREVTRKRIRANLEKKKIKKKEKVGVEPTERSNSLASVTTNSNQNFSVQISLDLT